MQVASTTCNRSTNIKLHQAWFSQLASALMCSTGLLQVLPSDLLARSLMQVVTATCSKAAELKSHKSDFHKLAATWDVNSIAATCWKLAASWENPQRAASLWRFWLCSALIYLVLISRYRFRKTRQICSIHFVSRAFIRDVHAWGPGHHTFVMSYVPVPNTFYFGRNFSPK